MNPNPILEELYAIREKLLADSGGDFQKYLSGVRSREAASGRLLHRNEEATMETSRGSEEEKESSRFIAS